MSDLEKEMGVSTPLKKSPKSQGLSPYKFFTQMNSPKKPWKSLGKVNKQRVRGRLTPSASPSSKQALKPLNSVSNSWNRSVPILRYPVKSSLDGMKRNGFQVDSGVSTSRRSLNPLFDPKLIESIEKELQGEGEQIKMMVSQTPKSRKSRDAATMLELFKKKCPPAGGNKVVIYTTTLRGIRKTFEDCNVVCSTIESHQVVLYERDVSMDAGYREELRGLMGKKNVKVPVVFVKGRLIGGVEDVVKLEEEGKLGLLFDGIPRASVVCAGCGGMRFVMCVDCNVGVVRCWMRFVMCVDCNGSCNGESEVTSAWQNPAAESGKADWELALVETASNLTKQKTAMGGGLDPLLLNGMYDQGTARQHVSTSRLTGGSSSSVALPGPGKPAMLALPAV